MVLALFPASYEGFGGLAGTVLAVAIVAAIGLALVATFRWLATRPRLPEPGPRTTELRGESPAIANFLVNRSRATSAAIPATLLDLAARGILGVEEYAGDNTVVRLKQANVAGLIGYEDRVLRLVRDRARNGSAPLDALLLDFNESDRWHGAFFKSVEAEAKHKGLARGRWSSFDYLWLGGALFIVVQLLFLSFSLAGVGAGGEDGFSAGDWFIAGCFAFAFSLVPFTKLRALRETARGRDAAAHWLGVREYYRESKAFDDVGPAAVTIWDRQMAYASALGVAHEANAQLRLTEDEPDVAWSRLTGDWRELKVEYPTRFGFGQSPSLVFLRGLGKLVLFGLITFFVARFVIPTMWDIVNDNRDAITDALGDSRADLGIKALLVAALLVPLVGLLIVGLKAADGLGQLIYGASDLGKSVVREGEVVKVHLGRVALDEGLPGVEELQAWTPPQNVRLHRGQRVRATMSPRLYHVTGVEVLEDPRRAEASAREAGLDTGATAILGGRQLDVSGLSGALGFPVTFKGSGAADDEGESGVPGMGMEALNFEISGGGELRVMAVQPQGFLATKAMQAFGQLSGRVGSPIDGPWDTGSWIQGQALTTSSGGWMVTTVLRVPGWEEAHHLEGSRRAAAYIHDELAKADALSAAP